MSFLLPPFAFRLAFSHVHSHLTAKERSQLTEKPALIDRWFLVKASVCFTRLLYRYRHDGIFRPAGRGVARLAGLRFAGNFLILRSFGMPDGLRPRAKSCGLTGVNLRCMAISPHRLDTTRDAHCCLSGQADRRRAREKVLVQDTVRPLCDELR